MADVFNVGQKVALNGPKIGNYTGAGIGVASSILNMGGQYLQYGLNKKFADYQNQMNIENWKMQNEYNTPVNQRKRLEDANLNPALAYGGAGSTGNATSSVAPYQNVQAPNFGEGLGASLLTGMQLKQAEANVQKTMAEAENISIQNQFGQEKAMTEIELMKSNIGKIASEVDNNEAKTALTWTQNALAEMDSLSKRKLNDSIVKLNEAQSLLASAKTDTEKENAKYIIAQEAKVQQEIIYQELINAWTEENGPANAGMTGLLRDCISAIFGDGSSGSGDGSSGSGDGSSRFGKGLKWFGIGSATLAGSKLIGPISSAFKKLGEAITKYKSVRTEEKFLKGASKGMKSGLDKLGGKNFKLFKYLKKLGPAAPLFLKEIFVGDRMTGTEAQAKYGKIK